MRAVGRVAHPMEGVGLFSDIRPPPSLSVELPAPRAKARCFRFLTLIQCLGEATSLGEKFLRFVMFINAWRRILWIIDKRRTAPLMRTQACADGG